MIIEMRDERESERKREFSKRMVDQQARKTEGKQDNEMKNRKRRMLLATALLSIGKLLRHRINDS